MTTRLIRLPELTAQIGIGKTKIYALITKGEFPAPIKIGKVSAWSSDTVAKWIEGKSRVAIQQDIE